MNFSGLHSSPAEAIDRPVETPQTRPGLATQAALRFAAAAAQAAQTELVRVVSADLGSSEDDPRNAEQIAARKVATELTRVVQRSSKLAPHGIIVSSLSTLESSGARVGVRLAPDGTGILSLIGNGRSASLRDFPSGQVLDTQQLDVSLSRLTHTSLGWVSAARNPENGQMGLLFFSEGKTRSWLPWSQEQCRQFSRIRSFHLTDEGNGLVLLELRNGGRQIFAYPSGEIYSGITSKCRNIGEISVMPDGSAVIPMEKHRRGYVFLRYPSGEELAPESEIEGISAISVSPRGESWCWIKEARGPWRIFNISRNECYSEFSRVDGTPTPLQFDSHGVAFTSSNYWGVSTVLCVDGSGNVRPYGRPQKGTVTQVYPHPYAPGCCFLRVESERGSEISCPASGRVYRTLRELAPVFGRDGSALLECIETTGDSGGEAALIDLGTGKRIVVPDGEGGIDASQLRTGRDGKIYAVCEETGHLGTIEGGEWHLLQGVPQGQVEGGALQYFGRPAFSWGTSLGVCPALYTETGTSGVQVLVLFDT